MIKHNLLSLYDIIIVLYIISIFTLENETFSFSFKVIQIIFIISSIVTIILRKRIILNTYIIFQFILLIVVLLIELLVSNYSGTIGGEMYTVFVNIIKIFFLIQYFNSKGKTDEFIFFMIIGGVISSLIVIFDYYSLGNIVYDLKYAGNYRIGANISGDNVNITSLNLCFAFSSGIYYLTREKRILKKELFYLASVILIFIAMLFTGSRKTLIFCLIVYIFQIAFKSKKKFIWSTIIITSIYICLIKISVFYFYVGHKIDVFGWNKSGSLYNVSDTIRKDLISGSLQLFSNNLFGSGLGSISKALGYYAHNNFVEILASIGIIGFIVYYLSYFYPLFKLRKLAIPKEMLMYFSSTIIGLLVIEWYQITYLYKIPMIFLALAASCVHLYSKQEG